MIPLIFSSLILLVAMLLYFGTLRKTRKIFESLNAMLDAALEGQFSETEFSESLQSSFESRFSQYLTAQANTAQSLAREKERINALIGDISHQTKTPIANLRLYGQLLTEQPLPPSAVGLAESMNAQAEKLDFLIAALVKLSRLESGVITLHPVVSPVLPMLEEAVSQIRPAAEQKEIGIQLLPTDARACFDEKWTLEAVYNLLDNAVKYTPCGGQIRVCAVRQEMFCRLCVADTGPGIPEEQRAGIWKRFYRAPGTEKIPGVGIGLCLTRQIVAGQGGYCKVSDNPDVSSGSVFSLYLPVNSNNTVRFSPALESPL